MGGTYVTNITHYLDEAGELQAEMPAPARQLASFLVLLIDAVTHNLPSGDETTRIRCRMVGCIGKIRASMVETEDAISWRCPQCGHHGYITNWQGTKWDGLSAAETSV